MKDRYLNVKLYTFLEIKEIANRLGITGNKVYIGIWAQQNGYLKKRILRDKQIKYYYLKIGKRNEKANYLF